MTSASLEVWTASFLANVTMWQHWPLTLWIRSGGISTVTTLNTLLYNDWNRCLWEQTEPGGRQPCKKQSHLPSSLYKVFNILYPDSFVLVLFEWLCHNGAHLQILQIDFFQVFLHYLSWIGTWPAKVESIHCFSQGVPKIFLPREQEKAHGKHSISGRSLALTTPNYRTGKWHSSFFLGSSAALLNRDLAAMQQRLAMKLNVLFCTLTTEILLSTSSAALKVERQHFDQGSEHTYVCIFFCGSAFHSHANAFSFQGGDFQKTLLYCLHLYRKPGFYGLSFWFWCHLLCPTFVSVTLSPKAAADKKQTEPKDFLHGSR